jgi:hypothetical protein
VSDTNSSKSLIPTRFATSYKSPGSGMARIVKSTRSVWASVVCRWETTVPECGITSSDGLLWTFKFQSSNPPYFCPCPSSLSTCITFLQIRFFLPLRIMTSFQASTFAPFSSFYVVGVIIPAMRRLCMSWSSIPNDIFAPRWLYHACR